MRVDKIYYEQLFPTGIYMNQRLGVEISLDESDLENVLDAQGHAARLTFKYAKELVEDAFNKLNPHVGEVVTHTDSSYNNGYNGEQVDNSPTPIINKEAERTEIAIDNCTSKEDLKLLEQDALKYGLVKQYLEKKKTFQL